MKVLLIGGAGQVGSEILRLAPARFALEAPSSMRLDISDLNAVSQWVAGQKPDIIINAAAYTGVDQAEGEPERAWQVNCTGPANLGRAARNAGAVIFHLSTDYVFEGSQDRPYCEADPTGPTGIYGASKLAGEQALRDACESSLILRTSWVFGKERENFLKTILRLASERDELSVVADQIGCPTSAASIAECIWSLANRYRGAGALPWGIYHFAGAPACSWHAFAEAIVSKANDAGLIHNSPVLKPISSLDYPTRARRPLFSALDCSLIRRTFDIRQPDWQSDLNRVIQALVKQ